MYPTSDRFPEEIRKSHDVYAYVDVVGPNQEQVRLEATGGEVTVDVTAQYRWYGNLTFTDPDGTIEALLAQPGVELRPYRGVRYEDGSVEVAPLGVLRISTIDLFDDAQGGRDITVECYDRSRTISRDGFIVPYSIPEGTNILQAIQEILSRSFDDLQYDLVSSAMTTTAPKIYDATSDPWAVVTELAASLGCEIFFNSAGHVVIAPPVDIDALPSPDFTYIEGRGCQAINLEKKYSDDPGYNGVVLVGESVGDEADPVMSIVWDDVPTSFTYHNGPYGEVPLFIQDQNVKTQSEADNAAHAWLHSLLGFASQVTLLAIPNPSLESGDVVEVVRKRSNVSGVYAISAIIQPMRAAEYATVTLRQKRTR